MWLMGFCCVRTDLIHSDLVNHCCLSGQGTRRPSSVVTIRSIYYIVTKKQTVAQCFGLPREINQLIHK